MILLPFLSKITGCSRSIFNSRFFLIIFFMIRSFQVILDNSLVSIVGKKYFPLSSDNYMNKKRMSKYKGNMHSSLDYDWGNK